MLSLRAGETRAGGFRGTTTEWQTAPARGDTLLRPVSAAMGTIAPSPTWQTNLGPAMDECVAVDAAV